MTDNTQVNTGTGDFVRDIDRSGSGPKTQVVQLDAGGSGATESLVSATNPLPASVVIANVAANYAGLPVSDSNMIAAQTSDQPLFVTIAGDPSGDFAGINILE